MLILDNYDSFVYNLAQYLGSQGATPEVYRNDSVTLNQIRERIRPDAIVISPGPGNPSNPKDFGVCTKVLKELSPRVPTLGVCMGHQGMGFVYGARIGYARTLRHGKTSLIKHDGKYIFKGIPSPVEGTRYHSLVIKRSSVRDNLLVTATSQDDGEIMGIRHREFPIFGVQFHPESIKTSNGMRMIRNFLDLV